MSATQKAPAQKAPLPKTTTITDPQSSTQKALSNEMRALPPETEKIKFKQ